VPREIAIAALWALSMSALLTAVTRKLAGSFGMLDVPNARSSHSAAVPRGGGLAIVVTSGVTLSALALMGLVSRDLLLAMLGGIPVAIVGIVDDRHAVPAAVRLAVHIAAALWGVFWLGGLPAVQLAGQVIQLGWQGDVLAVLGIVWVLNLFNFMDGIDGIAASEGVFVTCGIAALTPFGLDPSGVSATSVVLGASCLGFLVWNWPPAKIFMGDVGSGYLGYEIAVLALIAARHSPAALWATLILGGVFLVDSTVTLLRRVLRGERLYVAHRTHAYQWLARRWGHRPVTFAVCMLDVTWLLPCAVFATLHPPLAALTTALAFAPLVALAIVAGSGRPEQPDDARS
jgi:Fuc2NAc and GlcNAc transferase